MEKRGEIIVPIDKFGENDLKINWPDKKTLFEERDKYLKSNATKEAGEIKMILRQVGWKVGGEETVQVASRMVSEAIFMMKKMREITPISLNYPVYVYRNKTFSYDKETNYIMQIVYTEKQQQLTSMDFVINLDWVMEEAYTAVTEKNTMETDIMSMSVGVHEFAHTIYIQEAFEGSERKRDGLLAQRLFMEYSYDYFSEEKRRVGLLGLDVETRARLWQLEFLKKYFPNSCTREVVEAELDTGRMIRERFRNKGGRV